MMAELSKLWSILLWVLILMGNSRRSTGDQFCGVKTLLCSCQEMDSRSISMNIILCKVGSKVCEPCDRINETVRCRLYQYYCRQMINSSNSSRNNSSSNENSTTTMQPINYYTRCQCQNGGSCQNDADSTPCACPFGFHGDYCQFKDTLVTQITTTTNTPETRTLASGNCAIPYNPANGKIIIESDTIRTGEYIRYTCFDGYSLYGNVTRYCLDNGQFAGVGPTCEKPCIIPETNDSYLDYNINPNQKSEHQMVDRFGIPMITELEYSCANFLKLQGPARIRCKDGVWDNYPPLCVWEGISCPVPTLPSNSIQDPPLLVNSAAAPGTILKYNCSGGAIMKGDAVIVCTYSGTWDPQPPACLLSSPPTPGPIQPGPIQPGPTQPSPTTPVNCPLPNRPDHGDVQTTVSFSDNNNNRDSTTIPIGVRITYSCDDFYQLNTQSQYRECLSDGSWSGLQPQCVPECGRFLEERPYRIINGTSLDIEKWPWQVGLYDLRAQSLFCGGSIISDSWVLTAGHCLTVNGAERNKSTLGVFFGSSYSKVDPSDPNTRKIKDLILNPYYRDGNADIGLLHLETPIKFSNRMRPVCLPNPYSSVTEIVSQVGSVAGWGSTDRYQQILSPKLQIVNVKVVVCDGSLNFGDKMFCAANDEGAPCFGDSGGSLCLLKSRNDKPVYVMVGIVSQGTDSICATPGHYDVYTRVQKFVAWISTYAVAGYFLDTAIIVAPS